ncbi:hypothetical protein D3C80_2208200 [compost metagenome]
MILTLVPHRISLARDLIHHALRAAVNLIPSILQVMAEEETRIIIPLLREMNA